MIIIIIIIIRQSKQCPLLEDYGVKYILYVPELQKLAKKTRMTSENWIHLLLGVTLSYEKLQLMGAVSIMASGC